MKVYNMRDKNIPADAVYVGRPSKWGNPYSHLKGGTLAKFHVQTREDAVGAYDFWLYNHEAMVEEAQRELRGKSLVCWCAPLPCHADILMRVANETGVLS